MCLLPFKKGFHSCIIDSSFSCLSMQFFILKKGEKDMKKWTKDTAERYIKQAKEKGLTYWSAVDYLKHHKTMNSII